MDDNKIDNCPFCGSDDAMETTADHIDYGRVICTKCCAQGPIADRVGNYKRPVLKWNEARAPLLGQITILKQRVAEVEKDFSILEQNYDAAFGRVKELEQALRMVVMTYVVDYDEREKAEKASKLIHSYLGDAAKALGDK